jgi:hypothetical protein
VLAERLLPGLIEGDRAIEVRPSRLERFSAPWLEIDQLDAERARGLPQQLVGGLRLRGMGLPRRSAVRLRKSAGLLPGRRAPAW